MSDEELNLESRIGKYLIVTKGNTGHYKTWIYLGNAPQNEDLVNVEISDDIRRALYTHTLFTEYPPNDPPNERFDSRDIFKEISRKTYGQYVRTIELIRRGCVTEGWRAKYWADKYGFPVDILEEALQEGRKIDDQRTLLKKILLTVIGER